MARRFLDFLRCLGADMVSQYQKNLTSSCPAEQVLPVMLLYIPKPGLEPLWMTAPMDNYGADPEHIIPLHLVDTALQFRSIATRPRQKRTPRCELRFSFV